MASAAVQVIGGSNNVVNNISVKYVPCRPRRQRDQHPGPQQHLQLQRRGGHRRIGATNLLVQNSTTSYNNTLPGKQFDTGWEAGGIKSSASTNTVINGLTSVGNIGAGIWFDIANQNATVKNCL